MNRDKKIVPEVILVEKTEPAPLREKVILALNAKYPAMKRLFGITKVGIFGSVARGDEQAHSDIDIEVEFDDKSDNFRNFVGLSYYLEALLDRRVDLITTRVLSQYLRPDASAATAKINRDLAYLAMIHDEIAFLLEVKKSTTFREFSTSGMARRAVSRSLEIIGGASSRLSPQFRSSNPDVPWEIMDGMGTRLFHPYFGCDWKLVWSILELDLPELADRCKKIRSRRGGSA